MDELDTPEAVRTYYAEPSALALGKELRRLDRHCRAFIAASPFFVMATSDDQGRCDATPRGDAPGSVVVRDDTTLLIPDRTGNNRVDSMMNIGANPHIGLLFLVPGMRETLRVNGRARIIVDRTILAQLAADGKPPRAVIEVAIEAAYFQCGKAIVRSDLWNAERHVARGAFPPFGEVLAEQCGLDADLQPVLERAYKTDLY